MQIAIGSIGVIAIIFAVFYLFFPNILSFLNAVGREVTLDISALTEKYRIVIGVLYLIGGVFMIYIGFFFRK